MLLKEAHRVVTDRIRVVKFRGMILGIVFGRDERILPAQARWIVVTAGAGNRPIKLFEPSLNRPVGFIAIRLDIPADVPFAAHVSAITRRL